jgi:hypothetical protein
MVFVAYGRLLGAVIPTLKRRNVVQTITLRFDMLRPLIRGLDHGQSIHITATRALDQFTTLFPTSEETSFAIISFLMEFLDVPGYIPYVSGLLTAIFTNSLQAEFRVRFALAVSPLLGSPGTEPLMRKILATPFEPNGHPADELFATYSRMIEMCPGLEETAKPGLLGLVCRVSPETQISFLKRNRDRFEVVSSLWSAFFMPQSDRFNVILYESCFEYALEGIQALLKTDKCRLDVLNFLKIATAPEKMIGKTKTEKWFLLKLMPTLVELMIDESPPIAVSVQFLLLSIADLVSNVL